MRLPLDTAGRAALASVLVNAVRQEYPHMLQQELRSDASLAPPRVVNPSFYGSYDWHSAVHCHWALTRLLDQGLPEPMATTVLAVLDEHLSADRLAGELAFFTGPEGRTSERPYGWAWLVLLHAELARLAAANPDAGALHRAAVKWTQALGDLAAYLGAQLRQYFRATLAFPIRSGTHADTAFSLGLLLHADRLSPDPQLRATVTDAVDRWYFRGRLPWFAPPSGGDFLDPNLTAAALVAGVVGAGDLAAWLEGSGADDTTAWEQPPVFRPDGEDPGTVHLEGLLLTRAWCLHRLARALPAGHRLAERAQEGLVSHLELIETLDPGDGFNRAHWLPTFVIYLDGDLSAA